MNERGYEMGDTEGLPEGDSTSKEGVVTVNGSDVESSNAVEPEMMPMDIGEIADAVSGNVVSGAVDLHGDGLHDAAVVTSVTTDSREAKPGSLFVAIPGARVDGHDFVAVAAGNGAVAALVEHTVPGSDIPQIVVGDSVKALGVLARHNIDRRRELPEPFTIIGITGSVGKTTTKDLLHSLLSRLGRTVSPVGSFNNEIGLPLTALKVHASTRFFTAEMGASHIGDIDYLTAIAPPDISIALIVGVAHLGEFGSVDNIAIAKSEIIRNLLPGGISVLNADDPRVSAMRRYSPGKILWFGERGDHLPDGSCMNMYATDLNVDSMDHPTFLMHARAAAHATANAEGDSQPGDEQTQQVTLGIRGSHNVMNALAASAVAHELGLPLTEIADVLRKQRHISPHRMAVSTIAESGFAFTLIDDSFNANPNSVTAGVRSLAEWGAHQDSRPFRVAVLGAMLELGEDERRLHADMGALCSRLGIDQLIAVGGNDELDSLARDIVAGADAASGTTASNDVSAHAIESRFAHDIDEAEAMVAEASSHHPHTVVLLKGSHASGLSALADRWASSQTDRES